MDFSLDNMSSLCCIQFFDTHNHDYNPAPGVVYNSYLEFLLIQFHEALHAGVLPDPPSQSHRADQSMHGHAQRSSMQQTERSSLHSARLEPALPAASPHDGSMHSHTVTLQMQQRPYFVASPYLSLEKRQI